MSEDIDNKKVDPTLRKYENPNATVIQMLLAAKEGDVGFLRRCYRVNDISINPIQIRLLEYNVVTIIKNRNLYLILSGHGSKAKI